MAELEGNSLSPNFRVIGGQRYYLETEVLAWLKEKEEEIQKLKLDNAKWRKRNRTANLLKRG